MAAPSIDFRNIAVPSSTTDKLSFMPFVELESDEYAAVIDDRSRCPRKAILLNGRRSRIGSIDQFLIDNHSAGAQIYPMG